MKLHVLSLLLILSLAGCAHSPIDLAGMATVPGNEGVVCGQVKLLDRGEPQAVSFLGESKFRLFVTPDDPSHAVYVPLTGDGAFAWHLPAGRYTITSFEWLRHGIISGPIRARFEVTPGKTAYVGTLTILFAAPGYTLAVVDDYPERVAAFREAFPQLTTAPEKQLLRLEERR